MKILFYIESLYAGGKERRLVELIKGLKKYPDIEMELVLTREDIHYTEIFDTGVKIHYTVRKRLKKDPRVFWKFYKIAKQFKPNVIHVWGSMVGIYAIPSKIILNSVFVNNSISYAVKVKRLSKFGIESRISFMFSDYIIANSIAGLKAHNFYIDSRKIVVYNGFNFNRNSFSKTNLRKELNISSNSILVGMIASFTDAKDYKTYFDVAKLLMNKNKNLCFLCIGDGPNMNNMKEYVKEERISNVLFLGRRDDVENICKNIDIGVLLSNTDGHAEGISNSILEYMANELPVVATNAGGTPEIVKDTKSGFLVQAYNKYDIAKKITKLVKDKELARNMGREGKMIVENRFSINRMINSYISIYYERYNTKKE